MTIRQAVLDAASSTSVTEICQATGYTSRQVSNALYQLKALGKLTYVNGLYQIPRTNRIINSVFNQG